MQLETIQRDVRSYGMLETREATIAMGPHIMNILTGMYQNPCDAIVREYLTNMHDANIALLREMGEIAPAGLLHLPTSLDGNLVFSDNGIGMSKDMVLDVFTVVGLSTKNSNNDEVGGFGLGAKVAYCYNGGASWTIESRYRGEKHVFMAFVGTEGMPTYTHVHSCPTDDHSGVTIKIPIRRQDFNLVYEAAKKYVPLFPSPLIVQGYDIPKIEYVFRGKQWGVTNNTNNSRVIMGNVPYNIDLGYVFDQTFDYYLPVGSCDIVPSRDALKYTDKTKDAIADIIKIVKTELRATLEQTITSKNTDWEALSEYKKIIAKYPILSSILPKINYNGREILPVEGIHRTEAELQNIDPTATMNVVGTGVYYKDHITRFVNLKYCNYSSVIDRLSELRPSVNDNTTTFIIVDDLAKGGLLMIRAFLFGKLINKGSSGRAVRRGHHKIGHAIILKTSLSNKEISEFFGGYPENQILRTSNLNVNIPTILKPKKDTVYKWNGKASWRARVKMPEWVAGQEKHIYLPLTKDTQNIGGLYTFDRGVLLILNDISTDLQLDSQSLYGIKEDEIKNLDKTQWINFEELIENAIEKMLPAIVEKDSLDKDTGKFNKLFSLFDAIGNEGFVLPVKCQEYILNWKVYEEISNKVILSGHLLSWAFTRYPKLTAKKNTLMAATTSFVNLPQQYKEIIEKYPLLPVFLKAINSISSINDLTKYFQPLLDYFNWVG